ncbi:MAG TPA: serine protease [bacterium]
MIGRSSGARECRGHVAPARAAGGRGDPNIRVWAVILAAAVLALLCGPLSALGEEGSSWPAVFKLLILKEGGPVAIGTAFFVDPSGLALTNSHVVYRAQHDPKNYVLLAIFNKEFYGVEIVCASHLDIDPAEAPEARVGRDVAEIRLTPPARKDIWWGTPSPGGQSQKGQIQFEAPPHAGPLPYFPFFTFGDGPEKGGQVRIVGYGRMSQTREKIVATGTVTKIEAVPDGTPVFEIESPDRPEPGSSGSPVLNEQDRVVGMYTWNESKSDIAGLAISSAAFTTPCP